MTQAKALFTAVTELLVEGDQLSVVIRSATGTLRKFETTFDPSREIYIDFVLGHEHETATQD